MPKIIENVRENILEEAQKQLHTNGYGKTTIRSIATACNIGVGTVYNYFSSKDALIAAFMLEDWRACTEQMQAMNPADFDGFFTGVCVALKGFVDKYEYLFRDPDVTTEFAGSFSARHRQLRERMATIVAPALTDGSDAYSDDFLASYVVESILYWVMTDADMEDRLRALRRLAGK